MGASLGFFQDWMKAAGSAMPGMPSAGGTTQSPTGSTLGAMSGLGSWTMPTLDPQELEKRITDLKTVQFWLEQNARMIAMTIQGLEVQRMTLSTLKGMNVSMDALRESLKARAKPTEEPAAAPASKAEPEAPRAEAGGQGINPMQWWDTLTQQFTQLASQATQASVDVGTAASNSMAQAAASATAAATNAATSAAEAVQTAAQAEPVKRGAAKGAAAHPPKRKPGSGGQAD
ncbi:MAG: hypothetical protein KGL57_06415 [Burkholderiales bacterium]|nr:hypothetical protein [Burkholderiales bacterium]